ncbi:metalloreductase STEAP4-like [Penaeus monodon]|uniref:metalloreductase STEAP4-like n=1 Tax=Penaeus monodon TaxID=6687 RepID=UPI0018A79EB5|nr:metalloreductase STEAP4-like [Penaeus monodon]
MEMTSATRFRPENSASSPTPDLHHAVTSDDPFRDLERKKVVILGSGDMSLALSLAMRRAGMQPVVGSRTPESARIRLRSTGVQVKTLAEALKEERPPGSSRQPESVAERLQECLPESHVVKAFNTLSAFALQQGDVGGSKEVPISSDNDRAIRLVSDLVRNMGFSPRRLRRAEDGS